MVSSTITIKHDYNPFKITLSGSDIKAGKLNYLLKEQLPAINDDDKLYLICLPITMSVKKSASILDMLL